MLREAGAKEIHVRISSPPVKWPCFYGIDFASRAELVANGLSIDEICASIGADSLAYVELDALIDATKVPKRDLCRACFDGEYPVELSEEHRVNLEVFDGIERRVNKEELLVIDPLATDALTRP